LLTHTANRSLLIEWRQERSYKIEAKKKTGDTMSILIENISKIRRTFSLVTLSLEYQTERRNEIGLAWPVWVRENTCCVLLLD